MDSVVQLALGAEEFLVEGGPLQIFMIVNRHLESIVDMLTSRKAAQETAVLGGGVSGVSGVDDHAADVTYRLITFSLSSAV